MDFISSANLLLLFLNFAFAVYQHRNDRIDPVSTEIANRVLNSFFIPFHQTLGRQLFHKIDRINWIETKQVLDEFNTVFEESEDKYYFPELFILSFNHLSSYLNSDDLSDQEFRNLNSNYQTFSQHYFKAHNSFRKMVYLPKHGIQHQIWFKLYPNKLKFTFLFATLYIRTILVQSAIAVGVGIAALLLSLQLF